MQASNRNRTCSVAGCVHPGELKRGFCSLHYQRWLKHGDPNVVKVNWHGQRNTPMYWVWSSIVQRCTNPRHKYFKDYGGRGITIDPRWRDFREFAKDMGPRPEGTWIERIDNGLGYSSGNCRWATPVEQNRNKRSNTLITYNGETRTLAEWADLTGIKSDTIGRRIKALGWPVDRALTVKPVIGGHYGD